MNFRLSSAWADRDSRHRFKEGVIQLKTHIITLLATLLLAGCSTPYQRQGALGGFSETQLGENQFRVSFEGNAYTSSERVSDFTLLRSAELAMSHGFKYFTIADSEQAADPNSAAPPVPASYITASEFGPANFARDSATNKANGGPAYLYRDPIRTNTILAFKEKPEVDGRVYEAASVVHSMKERYGIESDAIEAPAATAEQGVTPLVAPEPPGKPVPVVATSQQPERPAESAVQLITGRVLGVTDGDTFTVRDDTGVRHKIHLASLDAPERLQAFWQGSKQALSGKLAGASVRVEWREKDRQGRLLGQVYLDDRWINREMIVEGWAWYHEPDSMNPDLAKAELAARAANAGLWSDPQPLAPWEFSGP